MRISRRSIAVLCVGCSVVAFGGTSVQAAELPEMIVTAQKRAEDIQDVPITLQAYNSVQLGEAGITTTDFLAEIVPNLQSARQIGASTPYLRGVGTANSSMGDESSIATYLDGVYMASPYGNDLHFNNLERVEVLKGPQGTLYGRNATGGLINIVTRDPTQEATGQIGFSYGDYDTVVGSLYAAGGITDNIAADIAVRINEQGEGYGDNLTSGSEINWTDATSLRSKWLFTPNDKTRITLTGDFQDRESNMASARGPAAGALGADGGLIFQGCLAGGGTMAACAAAAAAGATMAPADFQDIQADTDSISDTRQWGISGKVQYSFDSFDLVSITAYRDVDINDLLDQDSTPTPLIIAPLPQEIEQISQEFQLISTDDGPLSWIIGLYGLSIDAAYSIFQLRGIGLPLLAPGLMGVDLPVSQDTTSFAVFGQVGYDITDRLAVTVGARYTDDERDIDGSTILDFGGPPLVIPFSGEESWSEPTWRLAVDFLATDDIRLYGSYSRGFKSGVFNSVVTTGVLAPPVEPEILDAFEAGFKSDLAGGRVRLNGAAFYYDYSDLQLTTVSAGITLLSNAASAEVIGAEMELALAATDNLEIRANVGLLETEYEDYTCQISTPTGVGGNAISTGSCDGNNLIRAPELSGNVGATYTIPVASGEIKATFNWYYNDGFFWEPDNRYEEDSYDVLNAELSWMNAGETWRVRVFGNNLTDSEYSLYTNTGQFGDLVSAAPPLTWGVGADFYW